MIIMKRKWQPLEYKNISSEPYQHVVDRIQKIYSHCIQINVYIKINFFSSGLYTIASLTVILVCNLPIFKMLPLYFFIVN